MTASTTGSRTRARRADTGTVATKAEVDRRSRQDAVDVVEGAVVGQKPVYGSSVGIRVRKQREVIRCLKTGLSVKSFDILREELGVGTMELANTVSIRPRTLTRRRREGRLRPDESERVFRIGRLFDIASEVLGGQDRARVWFSRRKKALGGSTPLEYADTEPGAEEVRNLLGRLESGVFS